MENNSEKIYCFKEDDYINLFTKNKLLSEIRFLNYEKIESVSEPKTEWRTIHNSYGQNHEVPYKCYVKIICNGISYVLVSMIDKKHLEAYLNDVLLPRINDKVLIF